MKTWSKFVWLKTVPIGELLWTCNENFGFHKWLAISSLSERL